MMVIEINDGKIQAPFSPEFVEGLNLYQSSGIFHPFTCGNEKCRCDLVAKESVWECPNCDYTQDWAHEWMVTQGFNYQKLSESKMKEKPQVEQDAEALASIMGTLDFKSAMKTTFSPFKKWVDRIGAFLVGTMILSWTFAAIGLAFGLLAWVIELGFEHHPAMSTMLTIFFVVAWVMMGVQIFCPKWYKALDKMLGGEDNRDAQDATEQNEKSAS